MRAFKIIFLLLVAIVFVSCSSIMKSDKAKIIEKNAEFEGAVQIVRTEEASDVAPPGDVVKPAPAPTPVNKTVKTKTVKKTTTKKTLTKKDGKVTTPEPEAPVVVRRPPELEDDAGFDGRRPLVDPFTVGEEVVHDVSYFKVSAGELRLSVKPFAYVNGKKSYNFVTKIKTVGVFSNFYSVDDWVETLVGFDDLVPSVFEMHVKETNQLRESKMLFDNQNHRATFWEKKVTKKDGVEEKKYEWDIMPYAQNVFSIFYYMRAFKWETGKEYSFHIAHENENIVFKGKALRREVLETKLGPMKAIVIQPEITLKGNLKPIGDNFIWLSDDEHKYLLRIESKIKIGTLISEVIQIKK